MPPRNNGGDSTTKASDRRMIGAAARATAANEPWSTTRSRMDPFGRGIIGRRCTMMPSMMSLRGHSSRRPSRTRPAG